MPTIKFDILAMKSSDVEEEEEVIPVTFEALDIDIGYGTTIVRTGLTWPPVTSENIEPGFYIGAYLYAGEYSLRRKYIAFDLTTIVTLPSRVILSLIATTVPDPSMGAEISVRPYVSTFGIPLEVGAWGDLSIPAGDGIAGPFYDGVKYEFEIYPNALILGEINKFEIAINESTPPISESNEFGVQFWSSSEEFVAISLSIT